MEKMRLQKFFSECGVMSRRAAEAAIIDGRVKINGRVAELGESVDPKRDTVYLDDEPIKPRSEEYSYYMLHKPRGYITTLSDEKGRKNAAQLVADCGVRVYPVGRLDMDSEGLLLFTNDGEFANSLMHPKHEVDKTYRVAVDGYTPENLEKLKQPVTLDGYTIRKPDVKLSRPPRADGRAELLVTIHEGRNRQVRRMCAMAGMTVLRLQRIAEGTLKLGDLPKGKWRHLTEAEIRALK